MTDTVCTLFELRAGDDTVNEGMVVWHYTLFLIVVAHKRFQYCVAETVLPYLLNIQVHPKIKIKEKFQFRFVKYWKTNSIIQKYCKEVSFEWW